MGVIPSPFAGSSTPSGSAGGDLGSTYPNPTVVGTHLSAALPVNQGGTRSTTQNFVDLSTTQSVGGAKTFTANAAFSGTVAGSQAITAGVSALTDATTIAVNAALGNHFRVTLGGNRTLGAPTNPTDGQKITVEVIQDGTGSRTLAYNAVYAFGVTVPSPTLTTTANKRDFLGFIYNATATLWYCVAVTQGY